MNETHQGFKACLFHPNLGNEVVEGKIRIDPSGLHFESGAVAEAIPADRVVLELEKGGDRIYFTDPERPELKIFTVDQSILEHGSFGRCSGLREQLGAILTRRELWRRVRLSGYFLAGCLLMAWFGSWAAGAMARSLATRVPPEWRRKSVTRK